GLQLLPDGEGKAQLVAQRGLGEWTADWFLARHLARPEAWPAGDLGLRKAVAAFYGDVDDVRAFGARFPPFQNLTAHYLLTGLRVHLPGTGTRSRRRPRALGRVRARARLARVVGRLVRGRV